MVDGEAGRTARDWLRGLSPPVLNGDPGASLSVPPGPIAAATTWLVSRMSAKTSRPSGVIATAATSAVSGVWRGESAVGVSEPSARIVKPARPPGGELMSSLAATYTCRPSGVILTASGSGTANGDLGTGV